FGKHKTGGETFSLRGLHNIGKLGSHDTLPVLIDVEVHHSVTIIALPVAALYITEGDHTRNSIRTKMYDRRIPCTRQGAVGGLARQQGAGAWWLPHSVRRADFRV